MTAWHYIRTGLKFALLSISDDSPHLHDFIHSIERYISGLKLGIFRISSWGGLLDSKSTMYSHGWNRSPEIGDQKDWLMSSFEDCILLLYGISRKTPTIFQILEDHSRYILRISRLMHSITENPFLIKIHSNLRTRLLNSFPELSGLSHDSYLFLSKYLDVSPNKFYNRELYAVIETWLSSRDNADRANFIKYINSRQPISQPFLIIGRL